jgi:TatD DNase family protein
MIDSHCHIDLYPDPSAELEAVGRRGDVVVGVTNLPSHYQMGLPHIQDGWKVRLALGMHPLMATEHARERPLFDKLVKQVGYVGEVGLDFSPEGYQTRQTQEETFAHILERISDRKRFITLHSRRAESRVLGMLKDAKIEGAVFHWFSGAKRDLVAVANAGHLFSINPAMVASQNGRSLISAMPPDQVLTETDGPHVAIKGRPLKPGEVGSVLEHLAELWGERYDAVEARLKSTFERALPPKGERN